MSEQQSNAYNLDDYRRARDTHFSNGDQLDFHKAGENIKPYKDVDAHREDVARSYEMTDAEKQMEAIRSTTVIIKNLMLVRRDALGMPPAASSDINLELSEAA